jgi:hypothetical protein
LSSGGAATNAAASTESPLGRRQDDGVRPTVRLDSDDDL